MSNRKQRRSKNKLLPGFVSWVGRPNDSGCPVSEGTLVEVKFRDGGFFIGRALLDIEYDDEGVDRGLTWAFWDNDGVSNDIIAYRVIGSGK